MVFTKTKLEIIDETVKYYTENSRAITGAGKCAYETNEGLQCAHSRCLEDDIRNKVLTSNNQGSAFDIIDAYGDLAHKPEYRGHSYDFWGEIQALHDCDKYWKRNIVDGKLSIGNELTEDGVKFVETIKNIFKDK